MAPALARQYRGWPNDSRSLRDVQIRRSISFRLIWAAILLPGGFFLGGFVTYDGDPGTRRLAGADRRASDSLRRRPDLRSDFLRPQEMTKISYMLILSFFVPNEPASAELAAC